MQICSHAVKSRGSESESENSSFNADFERLASHNVLKVNLASIDMLSHFSVSVPLFSRVHEPECQQGDGREEKLKVAGLAESLGSAETHNFNFAF